MTAQGMDKNARIEITHLTHKDFVFFVFFSLSPLRYHTRNNLLQRCSIIWYRLAATGTFCNVLPETLVATATLHHDKVAASAISYHGEKLH